ncbi:MAG: rhomboid family intramembrane serine protease [Pirellulaceae bacterium]|nr:rhomboid family intramembrane serine protease [Planctomycetaceae bacterium]
MRQIGTIANQELAERFSDFMLTEGIATELTDDDDKCVIWAVEEDQLNTAREMLEQFNQSPDDEKYRDVVNQANTIRQEKHARNEQARQNVRSGREVWKPGLKQNAQKVPVTFTLIVACILVSLWTGMGKNKLACEPLHFVKYQHAPVDRNLHTTDPSDALTDIRAGQVWRLVTPMFLHFGVLHLLFNMMWLYQLGGQIEGRKGRTKYILMVLALAVFSSLVQVLIEKYAFFGGMSGVVYGLFGFIWMKVRFDPSDRFELSNNTVMIMLIWFGFCFFLRDVANGGHAGGLFLGVVMGYISAHSHK